MHQFTSFKGKKTITPRAKIFFLLLGISLLAFVKPLNYGIETPVAVGPYLNGVFEPVLAEPGADDSWQVEVAFPNVTFIDPLELVELPGTNKLVIVGKTGFVWTIENDATTSDKTVLLDISARTKTGIDSGLMGIAFHPDFGKADSPNRGYFYVMYRYRFEAGYGGKEGYIRVSRFTVADGSEVADESSELVLIQQYERHEFHLGGGMCFDNDGFLFLSFGDEGDARDSFNSSQKINESFFSGILRIDVDMDASRSHPIRRQPQNPANPPKNSWPDSYSANYYVPNDNPWVNANGSVLEEFYAIGVRNVFKMTYDEETDQLWGGEVGQGRREEVLVIEKGANYEWSYKEGELTGFRSKPGNLIGTETGPYFQYPHSQGACIIGGFVYRGTKWPSMRGKYIFGDHVYRDIYTIPSDASSEPDEELLLTMERDGVGSKTGITSFGTDASGEIYVLNAFESDEDGGKIYKLTRDGETTFNPPTLLSETGAFKNLETLEAADELIPYKVNSPLWSDGAAKKRWLIIPNDGTYNSSDEQVIFDENDEWDFPVGTVFIKHFELPLDQRNPSVTRKLETRFVILGPDNWVGGITYKWNEAGTDATLLETGDSQAFTVIDKEGNPFNQIWDFPSRGQCITCHNTNAKSVLGLKTHQLNGDLTYPATGITDNQLRTWNSLGMFANGPLESTIPNLPKSVPIDDPNASLDLKVSSYLDANCSHCHRPGGVITSFDARFQSELDKLIYAPTQSTASTEGSQIVIPGDALHSMLRIRDAAVEEGAMPPLARNIVDQVYIDTLTAWINSLNPDDYEIPCTEPTIDRLVWVNSDTDEIIGEVPNGGVINMYGRNHNINIVAVVDNCPETVGSVRFLLNGPTTLNRGESAAPYVLAGDNGGDYKPWSYQLGSYTLVATPYSEKSAKGTVGTPISVSFDIVIEDSNPCEEDPPSVEAGENVLLACDGTPSQITAVANEAGSFSWSGPNGFSANSASISITSQGTYTVLFTDLDNCTTSDQLSAALESPATVSIDQTSAAICEGKSIDLSATANGSGTFSWSGPNGFSTTGAAITVSQAGTYSLVFTNSAGCTASDAITVEDLGTPTVSIAQQSPVLCEGSLLTLTMSNPDVEGSYSWTGPNTFTAEGASVEISEAGT
ncbi:MAG: PQQ-dependent sugar dehydrogenase, partial [Bacteroidota bacterium]